MSVVEYTYDCRRLDEPEATRRGCNIDRPGLPKAIPDNGKEPPRLTMITMPATKLTRGELKRQRCTSDKCVAHSYDNGSHEMVQGVGL